MHTTQASFADYLRRGEFHAWEQLDRAYRPLVFHWVRRYDLSPADAEDVAQDVMAAVHQRVGEVDLDGQVGAFRAWLRATTATAAQDSLARRGHRPNTPEAPAFREMLARLEDPNSAAAREFDRQHDRFVVRSLLERVIGRFPAATVEAFRRHVLDGQDARVVAAHLGTSPRAVHVARSRVLRALREQAAGWLDGLSPA
jgi:RNA polymerase sigma-70 factor (ECF subfamily)